MAGNVVLPFLCTNDITTASEERVIQLVPAGTRPLLANDVSRIARDVKQNSKCFRAEFFSVDGNTTGRPNTSQVLDWDVVADGAVSIPVAIVLIKHQSRVCFTPVPNFRICPVEGARADNGSWTSTYNVFGRVWKDGVDVAVVTFGALLRGETNHPRILFGFKRQRMRNVYTRQVRGETLHEAGALDAWLPHVCAVWVDVSVAQSTVHIPIRESRTVTRDWHRGQWVTEAGTVIFTPQPRDAVAPFRRARCQHVDAAELAQLDARERGRAATLLRGHEVSRVQTAVPVASTLRVAEAVAILPVHEVVPQTGALRPRQVVAAPLAITDPERQEMYVALNTL